MSSPSIAIVCKSIDPSRGGHEQYLNRLIGGLLDRNWSVTVFARDDTVPEQYQEDVSLVKVPVIPLGKGLKYLTFNWFARRAVQNHDEELDLVFTTGKVSFGDVHRSGGGVHRVFLERCGGWFDSYRLKNIIACSIEEDAFTEPPPQTIVVNSRMVKEEARITYGTSSKRIRVVYNGVDCDRFHYKRLQAERSTLREEHGYEEHDFVCLGVGGDWHRKGMPELLEAFGRVDDPSVRLLVVGNTKEQRVRRIASENGFDDRVQVAGYTDEMERYYAGVDLLVFPSKYDAGANVVIEALATGLPVVTTRTNGTHELIEEGENGAVVDQAGDADTLAGKIKTFANRSDYEEMREHAFRVGQQCTIDRHLEEMEKIFREFV